MKISNMSLSSTVILVLLGGWLSSRFFKLIKLPTIMGMVIFGLLIGTFFEKKIPSILTQIAPSLKSLALIIILLRAGLGIKLSTLKKIGKTAVLLSFIPCLAEASILFILLYFGFDYSKELSGLTAFMLSAVSPAVIVPSMLKMKEQKIGEKKEIPTLVLAGASVDDVIAITLFAMFLSFAKISNGIEVMTKNQMPFFNSIGWKISSIPISIMGGILGGILLGLFLVIFFRWKKDSIENTERTMILILMAMILIKIGNAIHIAALLGIMTAGFILLEKSEKIANELSTKLSALWVPAEITLFVLIGMAVDIPTAINAGAKGLILIAVGLTARSAGVLISTIGSNLNKKEKLFCIIAYWPKATVQAALGAIALEQGLPHGNEILSFAVLSIILTAPIGLLGINLTGKKLLESD